MKRLVVLLVSLVFLAACGSSQQPSKPSIPKHLLPATRVFGFTGLPCTVTQGWPYKQYYQIYGSYGAQTQSTTQCNLNTAASHAYDSGRFEQSLYVCLKMFFKSIVGPSSYHGPCHENGGDAYRSGWRVIADGGCVPGVYCPSGRYPPWAASPTNGGSNPYTQTAGQGNTAPCHHQVARDWSNETFPSYSIINLTTKQEQWTRYPSSSDTSTLFCEF